MRRTIVFLAISAAVVGIAWAQTLPSITVVNLTISGTATAPTQTYGDNTTKLATTAFVQAAIAGISPPAQVPSGAVMFFDLSSCPSGWVTANGTSSVDVRGTVIRAEDLGRGLDTSGTGLGGYEADMIQNHTMLAPGAGFVTTTGSVPLGTASAATTFNLSSTTGGMATGNSGYETRAKSTVLLGCQKS